MMALAFFFGKQPLNEGQMELSLFHTELTPSEPPPTYSSPNVLPDHYIPALSFDSDSDATVQHVEPEEPIADNDGIIDPDYWFPSGGDNSSSGHDSLLNTLLQEKAQYSNNLHRSDTEPS